MHAGGIAVLCDFLAGTVAPGVEQQDARGVPMNADASIASAVVIANLSRQQPTAFQADLQTCCTPVLSALMLMMCQEQRCAASSAAATVATTVLGELTRGCEHVCSQLALMGGTDMLAYQLQTAAASALDDSMELETRAERHAAQFGNGERPYIECCNKRPAHHATRSLHCYGLQCAHQHSY